MLVLVRTVTGLERLTAAELAEAHHRVIDTSKRQLIVESTAAIVANPPRLADDLFLIQAAVPDPGPTRQSLTDAITNLRRQLIAGGTPPTGVQQQRSAAVTSDPPSGPARGQHVHPRPSRRDFAVTASFQGRRNYNRFDIEDTIGAALTDVTGGRYHSRRTGVAPPTDRVDWRVTLDGKTLWLGVRPYAVPLHRRDYRRRTVTGSLHPPIAAAMARLADLAPQHTVLDAFCGAGTLLLEAHAIQPTATYRGIDHNPAAIEAAQLNGPHLTWQRGDAASLSGPVDRILTNPPWDVRLRLGRLRPYLREWHRVLRTGGRAVAILNHDQAGELVADTAWRTLTVYDIAIAGQHPRIVVAEPSHR